MLAGPLSRRAPVIARKMGVGVSYDADASALFARFSTPATTPRKALINTLIVALKAAGVWSKLDALYLTAAETAQAGQQNWIADRYNLSPVNSPTFAADRGYLGDGSTSYLNTGFNPTTAVAPKFIQASAMLAFWSRTEISDGGYDIGKGTARFISRGIANNTMRGRIQSAIENVGANATSLGLMALQRPDATKIESFVNGASNGSTATALLAAITSPLGLLGATDGSYSTRQCAAAAIGEAFTPTQHAAFHGALATYLQAVGAA